MRVSSGPGGNASSSAASGKTGSAGGGTTASNAASSGVGSGGATVACRSSSGSVDYLRMWDLTVPGNNDHDFYVISAAGSQQRGQAYTQDSEAPVLVHNCGEGRADAKPAINKKGWQHFGTQEEARAAVLKAYGVSDDSLVESSGDLYGGPQNRNLMGPEGQPWEQLTAINDDGDMVTIEHHANGHWFEDNNTYEPPHYHGPDGEQYRYGDRVW